MEYCKSCLMYTSDFDEISRMCDDTDDVDRHFCVMYNKGIPREIENDKKGCIYHEEK